MALPLDRQTFLRHLRTGAVIVLSVLLLAFAFLVAKLDKDIRTRFAGVRWTLPSQVYAAPQDLYPGLNLSLKGLRHELDRLGYRDGAVLDGPGTYVRSDGQIEVAVRAFDFFDGNKPSQLLRIEGSARIDTVTDLDSGRPVELTRLDPLLIGSIYPARGGEDRVLIRLDQTPQLLKDGLLAVEDRGFYSHFGVSIKGIIRAFVANITKGKVSQGASTITQQLTKNFFLTRERSYRRKIKEILMSVLLEVHYSKDEILEAYLNEIYMGQDGSRAVHGFGLASQFYFNKPLMELKPHEMALLVAVVKGPSVYDPRRKPDNVRARRDLVLGIWLERGLIKSPVAVAAKAQPLGLAGGANGRAERYPAFVDLVRRQLKDQYPDEAVTTEGLRIYTSLNPEVQEALERRILEDLPALEKSRRMKADTLQAAGVVTSVEGGEVQAVVAGRDVRFAGFNRALDSQRSIGSLAKPFVFLTALQSPSRYNLGSAISDLPETYTLSRGKTWRPLNYDHRDHGQVPLYKALAQSYNVPTVKLGMELGVKAVQNTFANAGFSKAPPNPSIFLGAIDMAPFDVAQVYNTLAANGFQTPLSAIREVLTKEGEPLKRYPFRLKQTLPEGPVWLTTWALRKVIQEGTARAAVGILPPNTLLAGKTGTTDDMRDSWFAGYSADQVAVIWVGRDDYKPTGFTGGSGAMPIWARLMRDIDARSLDDTPPTDVEVASIGCSGYQLPVMAGYAPPPADCETEEFDTFDDAENVDSESDEAAAVEAILNGETAPPPRKKKESEISDWLKDIFE